MSSYTCAHVRARTHTHTHVLMTHDMYSMPGTYVLAITGMHTFQTEPTEYVCNVLVIGLSVLQVVTARHVA